MKKLPYLLAVILLFFGLYWMNYVMVKGYSETVDTDGWLATNGEIPRIDNSDLKLKVQFKRLDAVFQTDSLDKSYWQNATLYYQTHQDKYRLAANDSHIKYVHSFANYQKLQDSIDNWTTVDTTK